jgi:uncharacterized membrane protein
MAIGKAKRGDVAGIIGAISGSLGAAKNRRELPTGHD